MSDFVDDLREAAKGCADDIYALRFTEAADMIEELADQLETFKGDKWTQPELTRAKIEAQEMIIAFRDAVIERLTKERDELVEQINKLNGIRIDSPDGAMKMLKWWGETFSIIDSHKEQS